MTDHSAGEASHQPGGSPPGSPGLEPGALRHGGEERRWLLHRPASLPAGPRPLVLMFHGAGATAGMTARQTGWGAVADREGFLVAFPEGTAKDPGAPPTFRLNPQAWNDGSGRGHTARRATDDVGFAGRLLDHLVATEPVDPARVYASGFSNGASFAFRLGAECPARIAAVAAVAGHCWVGVSRVEPVVPLLYVVGDQDPLNPIAGGELTTPWGRREFHPAPRDSFDRWAAALGFEPASATAAREPGLARWRHGPREDGAEAEFVVIEGLGHVWPGGPRMLPARLVGPGSDRLRGSEAAWALFARHRRAAPC